MKPECCAPDFSAAWRLAYQAGYRQGQKDQWRTLYTALASVWPDEGV